MTWSNPSTFTSGQTAGVSSNLNTMVNDLLVLGTAWTTYTPTVGGWTLGNGSVSGRSMQAGKFGGVTVSLTFGSTTTVAGTLSLSIPFALVGAQTASIYPTYMYHSGTAYIGFGRITSGGTSIGFYVNNTNQLGAITSTVPFTWASGDTISTTMFFETA